MSSSQALLDKVPEHWASMVRPFLQRSREFEDKESLVSYFLRTHVAFLCMKKRKKEDKAGTAFLMALLEALEADKAKLGPQLDGVDGRTTLTRFALMLFARADDAERTGNSSMTLVRIFYTSAVLFEATEQFTEDGQMDNIAAQKCKYAKYIATRMKKALDANEPYVSPNKLEQVEGGPEAADIGSNSNFTTAPASCFTRPTSNPSSTIKSGGSRDVAPSPPPPFVQNSSAATALPPARLGGIGSQDAPPAYTYDSALSSNSTTPVPPSQPPSSMRNNNNNNSNTSSTLVLPAVVGPPPSRHNTAHYNLNNNYNSNSSASHPGAGAVLDSSFKPSVDQMIDAQKFAGRAVSALQFYDYENAKKQLVAAMQILNGISS